jgi:exosome complex RNA-binding protein Rrp42 (RNase PH superfamily)
MRDEVGKELNPKTLPVSTTFVKIANYWLVDPDIEEESCADTRITISTTEEHVCSIQKREGSLSKQELADLIELSFKTGNDIRRLLY